MATVKKVGKELRVKLTAKEVRAAAVDASWSAAIDDDGMVACEEVPHRVRRDAKGGYTVIWTLVP